MPIAVSSEEGAGAPQTRLLGLLLLLLLGLLLEADVDTDVAALVPGVRLDVPDGHGRGGDNLLFLAAVLADGPLWPGLLG